MMQQVSWSFVEEVVYSIKARSNTYKARVSVLWPLEAATAPSCQASGSAALQAVDQMFVWQ
jgi:hypothetical protein